MANFAVIGTRDPSKDQLDWIKWALDQQDPEDVLHTGACKGVDQIAAEAWLEAGNNVHLHLPWRHYKALWVKKVRLNYKGQGHISVNAHKRTRPKEEQLKDEARALASLHHPKWDRLSVPAKTLHARNVSIIAPCETVYAAPSTKPWGGGTAMGIKIALHLGKVLKVKDSLTNREWSSCGC